MRDVQPPLALIVLDGSGELCRGAKEPAGFTYFFFFLRAKETIKVLPCLPHWELVQDTRADARRGRRARTEHPTTQTRTFFHCRMSPLVGRQPRTGSLELTGCFFPTRWPCSFLLRGDFTLSRRAAVAPPGFCASLLQATWVGCASFHADPVLLCDTFSLLSWLRFAGAVLLPGRDRYVKIHPRCTFFLSFFIAPLSFILAEMGPRRRPSVSDVCRESFLWTVLLLWLTSSAEGTWKTGLYKPYSAGTQAAAAAAAAAHTSVYQRK